VQGGVTGISAENTWAMHESCGISVQLLGRFVLALEDGTGIRITARKGRALIAFLALQPGFVAPRERLAALLWGDRTDELARQNLRQCLVSLRREMPAAVADMLIPADDSIGLRADRLAVDVRQLLGLADDPSCQFKRAADLYGGPFLADLDIDSEAFAEWRQAERLRIEETAARLFATCAVQADQGGDGPAAVAAATRLTAIDPRAANRGATRRPRGRARAGEEAGGPDQERARQRGRTCNGGRH
jgi:DNA-binding SARP family transcriptional activator